MSFFVVARTSDDRLQLVGAEIFPSRQAAMASLSEATRDPDFAYWDADLLVVELDSAVPVLLVRPTQTEAEAARSESTVSEAPISEPLEIVEIEQQLVAESASLAEPTLTELAAEELAAPDVTAPADVATDVEEAVLEAGETFESTSTEEPPIDLPVVAAGAEVEPGSELPVEVVAEPTEPSVASQPPFTEVEFTIAEVLVEENADAGAAPLGDIFGDVTAPDAEAIAEGAAEAEAPISIDQRLGLDEHGGEPQIPAWEPDPGTDVAAPTAPEPEDIVVAWPWDTESSDEETLSDSVAEIVAEVELVEPAAGSIDDPSATESPLDAMLVDPLLNAAEPTPETIAEIELALEAEERPAADLEVETSAVAGDLREISPTGVQGEGIEPEGRTDDGEIGSSRDEIADFIFDLEHVTEIPETAGAETATQSTVGEGPACEECVYEHNCPNKDQRTPLECGSFQWKTR